MLIHPWDAAKDDAELAGRAEEWVKGLAQRAADGDFLFAVTDVALVLRRPAPS